MLWSVLLASTVALPVSAGLLAVAVGPGRPTLAGRAAGWAAGAAFVAALALSVRVALAGPVSVAVLTADRLSVLLLLLVTGLALVVTSFSRRYLRGDPAFHRFLAAAGLLASGTAGVATAATLVGLAAAWTVSGAALCWLLAIYRQLPGGTAGLRRTALSFAVGDAALWAGVLLLVLSDGDLLLVVLGSTAVAGADLVAVLFVVAALARSAQLPFSRWLPATVAAPTPVSALLHAGVVNAGGVLLIRTAPLVGDSPWATHLAFAAGAATVVHGAATVLTAADVKGALALSTTAQMGFMVMACALGAWAAAVVHLVAHGMYKAALFLGSGSAVQSARRARSAPPASAPSTRTGRIAVGPAALGLPALALALASGAGAGYPGAAVDTVEVDTVEVDTVLVLTFAWATGAALSWGALRRRPTVGTATGVAAVLAVAAPAYLLVTGSVAGFVGPAMPQAAAALPSPVLLVLPVAALAALTALRLTPGHSRLAPVRARLYVWALAAATAHREAPSRPHARLRSARRPRWPVPARPAESTSGARP